jgi:hypothetical protein
MGLEHLDVVVGEDIDDFSRVHRGAPTGQQFPGGRSVTEDACAGCRVCDAERVHLVVVGDLPPRSRRPHRRADARPLQHPSPRRARYGAARPDNGLGTGLGDSCRVPQGCSGKLKDYAHETAKAHKSRKRRREARLLRLAAEHDARGETLARVVMRIRAPAAPTRERAGTRKPSPTGRGGRLETIINP